MQVTDQPPTSAMTPADIAAHELASYVRPRAAHRDDVPALPKIPRPGHRVIAIADGWLRRTPAGAR